MLDGSTSDKASNQNARLGIGEVYGEFIRFHLVNVDDFIDPDPTLKLGELDGLRQFADTKFVHVILLVLMTSSLYG